MKDLNNVLKNLYQEYINLRNKLYIQNAQELMNYYYFKDAFLSHVAILTAIENQHRLNMSSRGSYLMVRNILEPNLTHRVIEPPNYLSRYRFVMSDNSLKDRIQKIWIRDNSFSIGWEPIRPIPTKFGWFENVWKSFLDKKGFD